MKLQVAPILLLLSIEVANAGECPLLVEPDEITVNTPVTANWTSVLACPSEPAIEISGSVVTVDFNFGYCPGGLPPGVCGANRPIKARLSPQTPGSSTPGQYPKLKSTVTTDPEISIAGSEGQASTLVQFAVTGVFTVISSGSTSSGHSPALATPIDSRRRMGATCSFIGEGP